MPTPRKRQSRSTSADVAADGKFEELDDISQQEKLRIIENSGILGKIPTATTPNPKAARFINAEDLAEEVRTPDDHDGDSDEEEGEGGEGDVDFDAIGNEMPGVVALLYSFPAIMVFMTFEVLVQQQFGSDWTLAELGLKVLKAYPVLLAYIYATYLHRHQVWMKAFQWFVSTAAGCYFIHLNLHSPAIGIMQQCPGLMTIWVYGVFMADNVAMVANLLIVGAAYHWDLWAKYIGR
ncbi:hypothetical protein H4R33_002774 [Dimargaris cristalligena]|uniref:DUF7719 domain-containing protein n=1 Tax=Dimargaris cristalligena TaxID=215637 RepID=A0A4P9ZP22_9FUNG|nr:hypothetical protein H4R33_002774 [Dimargaris cristalligena]RKP35196.1 hypothetical protein BJ085DRAFT_34475 [Dimargaris cristalligena]|eukprot:RKP35196.1 hypothetical protein BJ085DRAFT_34475 [Dimargaris cristalligena]